MLEILIALLMSLGINFSTSDTGKIEMSSKDYSSLKASETYQRSGISSIDDIVINDGVDPSSSSTSHD